MKKNWKTNWCTDLTEKQALVIKNYVDNGFDRKETVKKLKGVTLPYVSSFLKSITGKTALKLYLQDFLNDIKDTLEYKVIQTYITRAFYDPADIIDSKGSLKVKDLKKLGILSKCIEGIEVDNKLITEKEFDKNSQIISESIQRIPTKIKITLCDREKALNQLSKYIKIIGDIMEISGKDGGPIEILSKLERDNRIQELIKKRNKKT